MFKLRQQGGYETAPFTLTDAGIRCTKRRPGGALRDDALSLGWRRQSEVGCCSVEAGTVTLVLGDKPLELQQWTITDNKNQEVRVALYNAEFGLKLDNSLFRTPEKKKNPRN